jgi:hypothetical protein
MNPEFASQLAQKLVDVRFVFSLIFQGFELFSCLVKAFSGLLKLSCSASDPKTPQKTSAFLLVFLSIHSFGPLTLLMALLGSSWPLSGRTGPKMGLQNYLKTNPKSVPKNDPNNDPNKYQKIAVVAPQNGSKTVSRWPSKPLSWLILAYLWLTWGTLGISWALLGLS